MQLPSSAALRAEQARRSLAAFIRQAWPVVEPSTPFVPGWHLDVIAEHLEAVTAGEIQSLLITVPPRHMKSLSVAVFWPAWEWATWPERRWLYSSYALSLSIRDNVKTRRLLQSPWYQQRWGHVFKLTSDQNAKERFENDKTGYRLATSVDGANTGEGGDVIVVDDPHSVTEGESEPIREGVLTWWDETMSTRSNDPKAPRRVIVQQRVHQRDLAGHILDAGGWHHLNLPAEYEPRVVVQPGQPLPAAAVEAQPHDNCVIAADPRTADGELLWPARIGPDEIARLKRELGPVAYAGQYQQRPVPREGALFHAEWFRPLPAGFDQAPTTGQGDTGGRSLRASLRMVQFYDLAFSEKASADYTAAVTVGMDASLNSYLLHVWRERVAEDGLAEAICANIRRTAPAPGLVGIEEGAFKQAATRDLVQRVLTLLAAQGTAVGVVPVTVTRDKVFRAQLPAGRAQAGLVYADRTAPWWAAFEAELLRFPKGAHDDMVDALSGAMQLAIEGAVWAAVPPSVPFVDKDVVGPAAVAAAQRERRFGPSPLQRYITAKGKERAQRWRDAGVKLD